MTSKERMLIAMQNSMTGSRSIRVMVSVTLVLILLAGVGYCRTETANQVVNGSFEDATNSPWRPNAWTLGFEGGAQGSLSRVEKGFHALSAAHITNQTPRSPGKYIRLYQKITVEPDTDYVISMYVRCKSVGYAWFGGGPQWLLREPLPNDTDGKWVRVSVCFRSEDSDTWDLMIVSEDVAEGLDIDAVQVEKGKTATAFQGETFVATVENAAYAGIYESPTNVAVRLKVNNYRQDVLPVVADWQLCTLSSGAGVSHGRVTLTVPSDGSREALLPFPKKAGYGLYEYRVSTSSGGCKVESEARVAIMRMPPKNREMDNLGINIHTALEDNARLMRRMGLRWARVDWHWSLCAPSRDQIIWDYLDKQMVVADKYALKLFPIFAFVPQWAALKDGTFEPKEHADYVGSVLRRYKGKLRAIDVWNEPEQEPLTAWKNPKLWEDDLKAVSHAVHSIDPHCKIVGLTLSGNPGDPGMWWFDPLFKSSFALGQYLDVCDWHSYPAPRNRRPEDTNSVASSVDSLREWVPKVRDSVAGREVWITEHGFSMCNPLNPVVVELSKSFPAGAPFDVTERQQGNYLVRQVILELAHGIDRVFVYQLGPDGTGDAFEEQWGITRIRPNGLSAKVAYVQIANMIQELAGATPAGVSIPSPDIRVVRFRRGSTEIVAAWTVRGTAKLRFRVNNGYRSDSFGNREPRKGATNVEITESPIFLVANKVVFDGVLSSGSRPGAK